MGTCSQTNIPELNPETELCDGVYTSTACIVYPDRITALGIPAGTPLSDIIIAIVSALNNQSITINNLTSQIENQQMEIENLQAQIDACCDPTP